MSPLWNRPRLCGYLGVDHLALCQVIGRRRPRVLHKERIAVDAGPTTIVAALLDAWLTAHPLTGVMKNADLEIILGSPHVRYLLLPWDKNIVKEDLRESLARALFVRQFQEEANAQEVRFAPPVYGKPQVAAFVSRELIRSFEHVAQKHGGRLRCVEPLLAVVNQRFSRQLPPQGELLIVESSRLLKIRREAGAIAECQLRPCSPDELHHHVQKFAPDTGVKIFAPLQPALAGSLPAAWLSLSTGDGFSTASEGAYAYALCGVY